MMDSGRLRVFNSFGFITLIIFVSAFLTIVAFSSAPEHEAWIEGQSLIYHTPACSTDSSTNFLSAGCCAGWNAHRHQCDYNPDIGRGWVSAVSNSNDGNMTFNPGVNPQYTQAGSTAVPRLSTVTE
jgi:hypothetical protein